MDKKKLLKFEKGKERYFLTGCLVCILLGFFLLLGRPVLQLVSDPEKAQAYIQGKGSWGIFFFAAMIYLQTLSTCIPGGPFQIAAGFIYGGLNGALLYDTCAALGNITAFLISRKYGMEAVSRILSPKRIERVKWLGKMNTPKISFLVFLLPGTPKDLYAWLPGKADASTLRWFFRIWIARFPAAFAYTCGGDGLGEQNWKKLAGITVSMILLYGIGAKLIKSHKEHAG